MNYSTIEVTGNVELSKVLIEGEVRLGGESAQYDVYTGPYEVTPNEQTQTLNTDMNLLTDDIVINPIPSDYIVTTDATLNDSNQLLPGITAYSNGVKYTGDMDTLPATVYTPGTIDQYISAGKYLNGVQTIKGDSNLESQYIKKNITIFGVTGTLDDVVITQDAYGVLTIR